MDVVFKFLPNRIYIADFLTEHINFPARYISYLILIPYKETSDEDYKETLIRIFKVVRYLLTLLIYIIGFFIYFPAACFYFFLMQSCFRCLDNQNRS